MDKKALGKKRTFRGKSVLITGAAGGMGRAMAGRFGRAGARLALTDVDTDGLSTLAEDMEKSGVACLAVPADIRIEADCRELIARASSAFGGIDVLINNAGLTHRSAFADTAPEVFQRVMAVNFFGSLHCTHFALESLRRRQGMIIVISSIAGFSPLYGRTGYAASKHALHGLFESLRTELFRDGVDVLMVCPGFTATDFRFRALDGDGSVTRHPQSTIGKIAAADDVAEAIFRAACRRRRTLVLSTPGQLAWWLWKLAPWLYERLMARSLRSELDR